MTINIILTSSGLDKIISIRNLAPVISKNYYCLSQRYHPRFWTCKNFSRLNYQYYYIALLQNLKIQDLVIY